MFIGHWFAFCDLTVFNTLSKAILAQGQKIPINIDVPEVSDGPCKIRARCVDGGGKGG